MKYTLWLAIMLNSCTRFPNGSHSTTGIYAGVLPTQNGLVFYRNSVAKPDVTPATADNRARAWFRSSGKVLNAVEQNSITRKTDLVYLASLPARRIPVDAIGNVLTLPALRFWVTNDNTGDSTRIFVTNFETADKKGNYRVLEKQTYNSQQIWVSMWLNDIDAAVMEMMESLSTFITQPANR